MDKTELDKTGLLFEKLRKMYEPATIDAVKNICDGEPIDPPTAMFPPEAGKSFDYRQAETGFLMHDGDITLAGRLYFNLPPVGPYTDLPNGRFTFVPEPERERREPEAPPTATKAKPKEIRIARKRFKKPEAKDIALSPKGEVRIGRYTIGRWKKGDAYEAEVGKNHRKVTAGLMADLRTAIADASKRGITGEYKG